MFPIFTLHIMAAAAGCKNASFFGLEPWYKFLQLDSNCNIQSFNILPGSGKSSDIPLVLLAVIDDLLRIAGIVAVAFIIYGAFQLVASQGSPDASGRARGTILNALIGLAISIVAVAFVSYLGNQL